MRLRITAPGSLLPVVIDREITEDQAEAIRNLVDCSDGLDEIEISQLIGNINLSLYVLGNGVSPWDAPFGAGDSVEAYRG